MDWSFQLYSARNSKPWPEVLQLLASIGYTQVEGFGGVYDDPAGLRREMDRNGLSMPTAHFSIDALSDDFDGVRRIADALGVTTLVCPYLMPDRRPGDAAGWKTFAEKLGAVGAKAKAAGYGFAWHNHDFEFKALADGTLPQQVIVDHAPEIGLELDVAWVVRGGGDPLAWIDACGPRITVVHVKDIAPAGTATDEDGWADVGHGIIDWRGIMKALREKSAAKVFVMEHDKPSDVARFARRSFASVNQF